jgi:hypothetical protein
LQIAERLEAEYDRDAGEIPDHLRDRIMRACGVIEPHAVKRPRKRVIRRVLVASAAAAAVILAVLLVGPGKRGGEEVSEPPRYEVKTGGSQVVAWLLTRQPGTPADAALEAEAALTNPKGPAELDLSGGISKLVTTFDGVLIKR